MRTRASLWRRARAIRDDGPAGSSEPERGLVGVEDRFHLGAVVGLHLPQADDLAHDLGVVADCLGLGVDVADIVGDALLLFLEALDTLDQEAQAVIGGVGHWSVSPSQSENRLPVR